MSRSRGGVLLETEAGWKLMPAGPEDSTLPAPVIPAGGPDEVAGQVVTFFEGERLRKDRLLIALASRSVVFVPLPRSDLAGSVDRQTMAFRLESSLPLDAEQMVADFEVGPVDVGSVATDSQRLLPLVEALESRGLEVRSITPAAVLACDELLEKSEQAAGATVVRQADNVCDVLRYEGGRVIAWKSVPPGELARVFAVEPPSEPVIVVDADVETRRRLADGGVSADSVRDDSVASLAAAADRVCAGRRTPRFELRRGELTNGDPFRDIRPTVRWLAVAAVLFVASLVGALLWRAERLEDQQLAVKASQRSAYQRVFPGEDVPRAVMKRLRIEHAKVLGSRRTTSDVPSGESAVDVLGDFLAGLPTDVRSRVTEIQIDHESLTVRVELNAHEDAGLIASALTEAGFAVDPPSTTLRENGTITSTLIARWNPGERTVAQTGEGR